MTSLSGLLVVGVVTALVTTVCVPLSMRLARSIGAVAEPDERHVHVRPTPRLGGAAMICGLLAGFAAAWLTGSFRPVFAAGSVTPGVLVSAIAIFLAGAVDDVREVSPPAKLAAIAFAGWLLTVAGVTIVNVPLPRLGFTVLTPDLAALATVAWVVFLANATNLIDGLDGLAAGIVAIASVAFLVFGLKLQRAGLLDSGNIGPLIVVVLLGMCIGFLPWNFHPAKLFMGDSGALLLGFLMAAATISVGGQTDSSFRGQTWFFFAPLVLPLIVYAVPVLDLAFAVIRRTTSRKGFATADRGHMHHRLLEMGHGHVQVVLIMWALTIVLSVLALVPLFTKNVTALPSALAALVCVLTFALLVPRLRRWKRRRAAASDTPV